MPFLSNVYIWVRSLYIQFIKYYMTEVYYWNVKEQVFKICESQYGPMAAFCKDDDDNDDDNEPEFRLRSRAYQLLSLHQN